jgi:dihydroflavonol-4-reductase
MMRTNADGPAVVVRAAAYAGIRRLVHTSSAATIGEPRGTLGREDTPHRGWYLSTYERSKSDGERAAFRAGREQDVEVVCVNPASVQGPGRSGGTARFLLAFLDGRLKVFVSTNVSLVDIADCVEGHLRAADRGGVGERYLLSGITMTIADALALAAEEAGVRARPQLLPRPAATAAAYAVEQAFRLTGRRPPICQEMVRTLLHGHRYDGSRATRELGLDYTSARQTLRRTIEWAREAGLIRAE